MSTLSFIVLEKERSSIFRRPSFKKTVEEKEPTKTKQRRPSLKTFLLKLKSRKSTKKMAGRPKATSSKSTFHEIPDLQIVATASQDGSEIEAAIASEIFTQAPPYVQEVFENCESQMSQEEITDTQEITTQAPRAEKLQDSSPDEISVLLMEEEVSIQTVDLADTEVDKVSSEEVEFNEKGGNDKMEYTECDEEEYVEEKELDIRACEAPDALALCMLGSLIAVHLFAQ
jgi:hypothetical protein